VANANGNSVTELSETTGALVKVISGSSYGFDDPEAITSDGTHVWVANEYGNSVTELSASTGALVKVIRGSSYGFNSPDAVTSGGTHVWAANMYGNSVTEFSALTGTWSRSSAARVTGSTVPKPSPRTAPTSGWRTCTATRSPSSRRRPAPW